MKGFIEMGFWSRKCLFLGLLLLVVSAGAVEAGRPFSIFPLQHKPGFEGYSKFFATMGIECKCCDGIGGKCTSVLTASCSNLHCSPWKRY